MDEDNPRVCDSAARGSGSYRTSLSNTHGVWITGKSLAVRCPTHNCDQVYHNRFLLNKTILPGLRMWIMRSYQTIRVKYSHVHTKCLAIRIHSENLVLSIACDY